MSRNLIVSQDTRRRLMALSNSQTYYCPAVNWIIRIIETEMGGNISAQEELLSAKSYFSDKGFENLTRSYNELLADADTGLLNQLLNEVSYSPEDEFFYEYLQKFAVNKGVIKSTGYSTPINYHSRYEGEGVVSIPHRGKWYVKGLNKTIAALVFKPAISFHRVA